MSVPTDAVPVAERTSRTRHLRREILGHGRKHRLRFVTHRTKPLQIKTKRKQRRSARADECPELRQRTAPAQARAGKSHTGGHAHRATPEGRSGAGESGDASRERCGGGGGVRVGRRRHGAVAVVDFVHLRVLPRRWRLRGCPRWGAAQRQRRQRPPLPCLELPRRGLVLLSQAEYNNGEQLMYQCR